MDQRIQPALKRIVDMSYDPVVRRWAIRISGALAAFWLLVTVLGLEFLTSTTFYEGSETQIIGMKYIEPTPSSLTCRYWSGTGYRDVVQTYSFEVCPVYRWKRQFAD